MSSDNAMERAYQYIVNLKSWDAALSVLREFNVKLEAFLVYYDLRRRGRRVRPGPRPNTLIYEDPSGKLSEVLILSEGSYIKLNDILEWSIRASADSHRPVIAIIDETGVITYYEARTLRTLS